MSMYNILFGESPLSSVLLIALGITKEQCGRYRDCYLDGGEIVIFTRLGGGNRDFYVTEIEYLRSHPCYTRDEDDAFDCTYAYFYFSFPSQYAEELKAISLNKDFTPSEKWIMLFESMNNEDNQ